MRADIVAVGTELLLGQIANTNARWMSERLAAIGVDVLHHEVVGDNVERIVAVLRECAARSDVVLVTGGLGPTGDDLTRDAIAATMGVGMVRHPELEEMLREKFRGYGRGEMPATNLRQADVPEGARYVVPERGTAPGLVAELPGGATVFAMAGVPAEMIEVMEGTVLPELVDRSGAGAIVSRVIKVVGMGESAVAERIDDLFGASTNPTVAFLAGVGDVKVRLTAKAASRDAADVLIAPVLAEVRARLGDVVYSDADETLEAVVLRLLTAAGRTLACAESLTGGGVGARLTAIPGASASFVGSAVVYTPEAKRAVLGVPAEVLNGSGPVSSPCAIAMAHGARRLFGSDVAIALTGVAGPEGHGDHVPGTVVVALAADGVEHARAYATRGERDRVRGWAEQAALDLVRRHLAGLPLPASSLDI